MASKTILVTREYRRMTTHAILAIVFFMVVYLLLVLLALVLTGLCGFAGLMLIATKPTFITIAIGGGLISFGVLVLIFLLKFIFKKNVADRSGLVEITEQQEPQLYAFIKGIVQDVHTRFPKKIYISPDVNACVFYDSSFWSMFLPVKKNLQIGLGLVNTISVNEFRAILAHEFGHFSQKTMKVGSYVYNVNQIIFNMLFDNDSYHSLAQNWANVGGIIAFFVKLAIKMVGGIQWVLRLVYNVVNINYMKLSREMEFQADEVAARVAGSEPLATSLLRMDMANFSYDKVVKYYGDRVDQAIKTKNIYPQQTGVMLLQAAGAGLPMKNGLPLVCMEFLSRFNKSKLVIKDQWASHPSTPERVSRLKKLNIEKITPDDRLAFALFRDPERLQEQLTDFLFSSVTYTNPEVYVDNEEFMRLYSEEVAAGTFGELFCGYYEYKTPSPLDVDQMVNQGIDQGVSIDDLFAAEAVDRVYTSIALEKDIQDLNQIIDREIVVKSFDYAGKKYVAEQAKQLSSELEIKLKEVQEEIVQNDTRIYLYFLSKAMLVGKEDELKRLYARLQDVEKDYDHKFESYVRMINGTMFIYEVTSFHVIEQNFKSLLHVETDFKHQINDILQNTNYQPDLSPEMKEGFTNYLSKEWEYFSYPEYNDPSLSFLFQVMNDYRVILSKTFLRLKKDLLDFMESLERQQSS